MVLWSALLLLLWLALCVEGPADVCCSYSEDAAKKMSDENAGASGAVICFKASDPDVCSKEWKKVGIWAVVTCASTATPVVVSALVSTRSSPPLLAPCPEIL